MARWEGLSNFARLDYLAPMHAPASPTLIEPDLLMLAYRGGVFPMADSRDDPEVFWVEPENRAILPLDGFRMSRSLARTLRRERFRVTCNAAFAAVMDECAAPRNDGTGESWISLKIAASYQNLHRLGLAHSIECWQGEVLVGGLYGVGFDRVFCGESMFARVPDASKVALAWLVAALRSAGAELLDCQFLTGHLASLGAVEMSQADYVARLRDAQRPLGLFSGLPMSGVGAGEGLGGDGGDSGGAAAGFAALPDGFAALLAAAAGGASSSPGNFIAQSLTQTS
jgi:leucyl/phenylalanyl-tRNA---protein transferase